MDSSLRDSRVNPVVHLDGEKAQLRTESLKMEENEEETLLVPSDQKEEEEEEEEVKPKRKRKVQWNDTNGKKLAEIMEFLPSDVSDSDEEDSDSCFCTIM